MTDPQENKLSMYHLTEEKLNYYNSIWGLMPAFAATKSAYSAKIIAIHTTSAQQQAVITGIAGDKKTLKLSVIDITAPVAAIVKGFASQTNNLELFNAVNFSHSQLVNTRDEVLGDICQNIHTRANDNLVALAPYGITAPMLAAVQTAINTYTAKVPAPGSAKVSKKTATSNLRQLFTETDTILNDQLDQFMLQFKTTQPTFHTDYTNARILIDLGATHTKLNMFVKDQHGNAMQGVSASLIKNNLILYTATTNAEGKITFSKIKPGTYDLKTEKPGFATKVETGILFKPGKKISRTVTLVPGVSSGGITIIREGDVLTGNTANLDATGINPNINSTVLVEIALGGVRIYAASTVDGVPGTVFWDVPAGTNVVKSVIEFGALIGVDDTKHFIRIQCLGPTDAHFKFTFSNLG